MLRFVVGEQIKKATKTITECSGECQFSSWGRHLSRTSSVTEPWNAETHAVNHMVRQSVSYTNEPDSPAQRIPLESDKPRNIFHSTASESLPAWNA